MNAPVQCLKMLELPDRVFTRLTSVSDVVVFPLMLMLLMGMMNKTAKEETSCSKLELSFKADYSVGASLTARKHGEDL